MNIDESEKIQAEEQMQDSKICVSVVEIEKTEDLQVKEVIDVVVKSEFEIFYNSLVENALSKKINFPKGNETTFFDVAALSVDYFNDSLTENEKDKKLDCFFSPETISRAVLVNIDSLISEYSKVFTFQLEEVSQLEEISRLDAMCGYELSISSPNLKKFLKFLPESEIEKLPGTYKKLDITDVTTSVFLEAVKNCTDVLFEVIQDYLISKKFKMTKYDILNLNETLKVAVLKIIVGADFNFYFNVSGFVEVELKKKNEANKNLFAWFNQDEFKMLVDDLATSVNKDVAKDLVKKIKKNIKKGKVLVGDSREKIITLKSQFPHFAEVVDYIDSFLSIQEKSNQVFYFPPILLNGEPGIGKTFFLLKLAEYCNLDFHVENMASITTGSRFTGTEAHWGTSAEGLVLNTLLNKKNLNPMILLDELDKTATVGMYGNPTLSLLNLLEKATAKRFTDVSIDLTIDASNIIWLASSNGLNTINNALLSRFVVFNVRPPNKEERKLLTQSIYLQMLKDNSWDNYFNKEINENILDYVVDNVDGGSARETKKILQSALAIAAKESKTELEKNHFIYTSKNSPKIGF